METFFPKLTERWEEYELPSFVLCGDRGLKHRWFRNFKFSSKFVSFNFQTAYAFISYSILNQKWLRFVLRLCGKFLCSKVLPPRFVLVPCDLTWFGRGESDEFTYEAAESRDPRKKRWRFSDKSLNASFPLLNTCRSWEKSASCA